MTSRIAVTPTIHFGKPCVAGTRIPVVSVLELLCDGVLFDEIINNFYPELALEDVRACVRYAIDVVTAEDIRITPQP